MALEQYFFCACRIVSILLLPSLLTSGVPPEGFENLPVHNVAAADNTEYRENGDEYAPSLQPAVDGQADEKAETDATRHGQADLKDDGQMFRPVPVFPIIEKFLAWFPHGLTCSGSIGESAVGITGCQLADDEPTAFLCRWLQ